MKNIKKVLFTTGTVAIMFGSMIAPAFASGGPTPGPEAGPGCFGNWRAGSVQVINGTAPGTDNAGALYFSQRAGDNSTINADNRATCAAL
jgi:hypothetical protein